MGLSGSKMVATADDNSADDNYDAEAQSAAGDGRAEIDDWRNDDNNAPDATEMQPIYGAPPRVVARQSEIDAMTDDNDYDRLPAPSRGKPGVDFVVGKSNDQKAAEVLNPNASRRGRTRALFCIAGALGATVTVTVLGVALWRTGFLHFGKKVDATATVPAVDDTDDDFVKMLKVWAELPEKQFWSFVEKRAFTADGDWGVLVFLEVTRFLSAVVSYMLGEIPSENKTNAKLDALKPSETEMDALYADWKGKGRFTTRYLFDKSAAFPPASASVPNDLYRRAIRLYVLSHLFQRGLSEMMQSSGGTAGGNGT